MDTNPIEHKESTVDSQEGDHLTTENREAHKHAPTECPINATLKLVAYRWTVHIIYHLYSIPNGIVRFRQLQRLIPSITQKELTKRLRELERAGIIHRTIYAEVPPRVKY